MQTARRDSELIPVMCSSKKSYFIISGISFGLGLLIGLSLLFIQNSSHSESNRKNEELLKYNEENALIVSKRMFGFYNNAIKNLVEFDKNSMSKRWDTATKMTNHRIALMEFEADAIRATNDAVYLRDIALLENRKQKRIITEDEYDTEMIKLKADLELRKINDETTSRNIKRIGLELKIKDEENKKADCEAYIKKASYIPKLKEVEEIFDLLQDSIYAFRSAKDGKAK